MTAPEYTHRLIFGTLFAIGALGIACCLTFFWGLGLLALVLFAILQCATDEFCQLARQINAQLTYKAAPFFVSSVFVLFCNGFEWSHWSKVALLCHLALYLSALIFIACAMKYSKEPLIDIATLILGAIYLALPLAALYNLISDCGLDFQLRQWWAIYAVAVTKMTDIGAWMFGKLWGRSPLGLLSPHKTVEGVWGGLLIGCCAGLILHCCQPHYYFSWQAFLASIPLHLSVSGIAQIGDLLESLLKRAVGVRHSGKLPGLGGILDLVDSLLLTAPFLYLWHRL